MARIEDYALIGDCRPPRSSAATARSTGSACRASTPAPASRRCSATPSTAAGCSRPPARSRASTRRYRDEHPGARDRLRDATTAWSRVVDFMPLRGEAPDVVRIVEGVEGTVPMRWSSCSASTTGRSCRGCARIDDGAASRSPGPTRSACDTPVQVARRGPDAPSREFTVGRASAIPFVLTLVPVARRPRRTPIDAEEALERHRALLARVGRRAARYDGDVARAVLRSLITLKALTYAPTGGIVAAPTTSLPERLGGVRNWDYRYCWLRDATFTLYALMLGRLQRRGARLARLAAARGRRRPGGAADHVRPRRRAAARPSASSPGCPGYEGSTPGAHRQRRLASSSSSTSTARCMDALLPGARARARCRRRRLVARSGRCSRPRGRLAASRTRASGRCAGRRRHFTHSKVMAWVAFDRGVRLSRSSASTGPVDRWRALRDEIHAEVLRARATTRSAAPSSSPTARASSTRALLLIPLVGFLPRRRPARRRHRRGDRARADCIDGFVLRYHTAATARRRPPGRRGRVPRLLVLARRGLALRARHDEARELFERLLALRNDVGLLAEEYDPRPARLLGNFPQAFTHLALVEAALALAGHAMREAT